MERKGIKILGVRFDVTSLEKAKEELHRACERKDQLFVVTPNPEMCLEASRNPKFRKILESAGLSIPDGFGVILAARFLYGWETSPLKKRVTGTDLMAAFLQDSRHRRIFLLGADEEVNKKLTTALTMKGIHIAGSSSAGPGENKIIRPLIMSSGAEVLFVAYGSPKQEVWIRENLPHLPHVHVAVGVGGAFDFLSGVKKRAPRFLQRSGLEWMYRLWKEPRRVGRIIRATILFPFKVFTSNHE